jgi:hypothetical protein
VWVELVFIVFSLCLESGGGLRFLLVAGLACPAGSRELDKPGLSRLLVPDEDFLAGPLPLVHELVADDGAVQEIGRRQAGPVLKTLEAISGLRDQGNRDVPV